jgi:hypothetical protein
MASPLFCATTPFFFDASVMAAPIDALVIAWFGPSSQVGANAARPCLAAHMWSATTATAPSSLSTWRTPLTAIALASSALASLPPGTGDAATVAIAMLGRRASMPNSALPLTLSGESSRLWALPIRVNALTSFSLTFFGAGSLAAASTSSP